MSETKTITVQGASGMTIEFTPFRVNINVSVETKKKITILSDGEPRQLPITEETIPFNEYLDIANPEQLALQLAAKPYLQDFLTPALLHMTKDYDAFAAVTPPVEDQE